MLFAGLSDALDGFLARRYGWQTELGSLLDPLADKFLVAAMYLVFTLHELIPVWLVALILTRDILILLGAGVYRGVFGDLTVNPSLLSKTNTAVQISIVLLLMVSQMPIGELGGELLTVLGDVGYPLLAACVLPQARITCLCGGGILGGVCAVNRRAGADSGHERVKNAEYPDS